MTRFLILAGYCLLSLYLYLSDKLDQYINTRYTYLAFMSAALAFILACVQLLIWVKADKYHTKSRFGRLFLSLPIVIGFLGPTVRLDATTVASKGYYLPLATGESKATQSPDGTDIQYLNPDTSLYFTRNVYEQKMAELLNKYQHESHLIIDQHNYMELMELIYRYPSAFLGKTISYSGFIYRDPEELDQQFLFRFGIIHCIADSGVYGLLTKGEALTYEQNTWVQVTGQLTQSYHQQLGQYLPTLDVTDSSAIDPPKNPYVYRTFY